MNQIELPVSELKTVLSGLNKIVSRSTCLPVLKNVRVTRHISGAVTLQATDIDVAATYQTAIPQPGLVCDMLVPMESLGKIVKNCTNDSRIILLKESKDQCTLRTFVGHSAVDHKLETLELKEWPVLPTGDAGTVTLDQHLREAVAEAMECCSDDSTRQQLNGAWIDPTDPKANYVLGTDGRHLFTSNSFSLDLKTPVLLPKRRFLQWSGFKDDGDWKVSVLPAIKKEEKGWLQLQSQHWTFVNRIADGQCPNWRQVVPSPEESKTLVVFHKNAQEFLQQLLPNLPGSDIYNQPVTLEIEGRALKIKAHPRNSQDWTSVLVPEVDITGLPITIMLNRDFLAKALDFGLLNLHLYDDCSPMVFFCEGKRMVVMPLKPDNAVLAANSATASNTATTSANTEPQAAAPAQAAENEPSVAFAPTPTPPNPQPQTQPMTKTTEPPKETPKEHTAPTTDSPTKPLVQHIELIKESLKGVLRELNELLDMVKKAEKEKRTSDKEIEAVREKLREIQSVKL